MRGHISSQTKKQRESHGPQRSERRWHTCPRFTMSQTAFPPGVEAQMVPSPWRRLHFVLCGFLLWLSLLLEFHGFSVCEFLLLQFRWFHKEVLTEMESNVRLDKDYILVSMLSKQKGWILTDIRYIWKRFHYLFIFKYYVYIFSTNWPFWCHYDLGLLLIIFLRERQLQCASTVAEMIFNVMERI